MGEAKAKRTRLEKLQLRWTYCVYCGGTTPGEQVEHVPPIIMFNGRRRPGGLELLACAACNQGSRGDDQFASLISRIAGVDRERFPVDIAETRKLRTAVSNNYPDLMREMHWNTPDGLTAYITSGRFRSDNPRLRRADGPLFSMTMRRFVSKVGLALHAHSTGRILGLDGVVYAWPVFNLRESCIPMMLFNGMTTPVSLRQGTFNVSNQFFYTFHVYHDGGATICYAQFRDGFGMWAYCADDISRFGATALAEGRFFRPGFLKERSPASIPQR